MMLLDRWREIPPPAKKDYVGKHLLLCADPAELDRPAPWEKEPKLDLTDAVVCITRRCNAKDTMGTCNDVAHWGGIRVVRVVWTCPHCAMTREIYLPESWIADGKAVFVEKLED